MIVENAWGNRQLRELNQATVLDAGYTSRRCSGHVAVFNFVNASAVVAFLLMAPLAGAQNTIITDPEIAAELISGKFQRVWIAEAVKAPLGGTSCEKGLRYRFRSDQTAELESCVDGAWSTKAISWSVSGGGIYVLNVILEETTYEATLVERPDDLELVLESHATYKDIKTARITMNYTLD